MFATEGARWKYQASNEETICRTLQDYHAYYQSNPQQRDKTRCPLFTVLAGPGTGKSRLLDEIPNQLHTLFPDRANGVGQRLGANLLVFKISFENGAVFALNDDSTARVALTSRMVWQCWKTAGANFNSFRHRTTVLGPADILTHIAARRGVKVSDLTVILCVDAVQLLPGDPHDKTGLLYSMFTECGELVRSSPAFVIAVVAATVLDAADGWLADSPRLRVCLFPPGIDALKLRTEDGRDVFKNDHVVRMMVRDMGGHGRALEALFQKLDGRGSGLTGPIVSEIMNSVKTRLEEWYPNVGNGVQDTEALRTILNARLAHQRFELNQVITGQLTPKQLVRAGLFTYDIKTRTLACPFIWLWLLTRRLDNPLLDAFGFDDYAMQVDKPSGHTLWSRFEQFIATFRCLRGAAAEGKIMQLKDLHAGCAWSHRCDINVKSQALELRRSMHQQPSRSDRKLCRKRDGVHQWETMGCHIQTDGNNKLDVAKGDTLVINAPGAPAADVFCCLHCSPRGRLNEAIAPTLDKMKPLPWVSENSSQPSEMQKAAGKQDVFVLVTPSVEHVRQPAVSLLTSRIVVKKPIL